MRRPVMYLAGLLLATGASLALAGPASAAPSHDVKCHHHGHHHSWLWDNDDDEYDYYNNFGDIQSNNRGVFLLSNNNGGLFGLL